MDIEGYMCVFLSCLLEAISFLKCYSVILILLQYAISLTKYDRHGYSMRNRVLIMTDKCVYVVDEKTFKLKDRIPFENIKGRIICVKFDDKHLSFY